MEPEAAGILSRVRWNTDQSDEYPDVLEGRGPALRTEWPRCVGACSVDRKPGAGHHRVCGVRRRGRCVDLDVLSPHDRTVPWRGRGEHSSGALAGRGAPLDSAQLGPRRPGRALLVGSPQRLGETWMTAWAETQGRSLSQPSDGT